MRQHVCTGSVASRGFYVISINYLRYFLLIIYAIYAKKKQNRYLY
jgi:hypothetical protein